MFLVTGEKPGYDLNITPNFYVNSHIIKYIWYYPPTSNVQTSTATNIIKYDVGQKRPTEKIKYRTL